MVSLIRKDVSDRIVPFMGSLEWYFDVFVDPDRVGRSLARCASHGGWPADMPQATAAAAANLNEGLRFSSIGREAIRWDGDRPEVFLFESSHLLQNSRG